MDSNYKVVITVEDEGYFKKSFNVQAGMNLKKLLDHVSAHVCPTCSNTGMLEFWYNTTKLRDGQTAYMLGMQRGDVININILESCTRGACPVPLYQTAPNMHYLSKPVIPNTTRHLFYETKNTPKPPRRIRLKFQSQDNFEMVFRFKKDAAFNLAMQIFASYVNRDMKECRFVIDGERIVDSKTAIDMDLEDDDLIQVFYEVLGGGA